MELRPGAREGGRERDHAERSPTIFFLNFNCVFALQRRRAPSGLSLFLSLSHTHTVCLSEMAGRLPAARLFISDNYAPSLSQDGCAVDVDGWIGLPACLGKASKATICRNCGKSQPKYGWPTWNRRPSLTANEISAAMRDSERFRGRTQKVEPSLVVVVAVAVAVAAPSPSKVPISQACSFVRSFPRSSNVSFGRGRAITHFGR